MRLWAISAAICIVVGLILSPLLGGFTFLFAALSWAVLLIGIFHAWERLPPVAPLASLLSRYAPVPTLFEKDRYLRGLTEHQAELARVEAEAAKARQEQEEARAAQRKAEHEAAKAKQEREEAVAAQRRAEAEARRRTSGGPASDKMTRAKALRIFNLGDNPTPAEINAAYKRVLKQNHPDLGGSEELAKDINTARDILMG